LRGSVKENTRDGRRRRAPSKSVPPVTARRAVDETRTRVRLGVDERRAQLVELGLAEFVHRPYDEISIEHIAHSAGISKGLLYHYFPTKRAFYVACVRLASANLLARLKVPLETPPFERLNVQVDRYLEFVTQHSGAFATLMRNHAGADPEVAAAIDETRKQVLAYLTNGLGDVLPEATASPLVQIALHGWIGLVEGASLAWVESRVAGKANTPNAVEVRDLLVRALVSVARSALRAQLEPRAETKTSK
jgi:AcrR family transcriptional regulator